MKVRLKSDIAGTRDGKEWPSAGSEVDLPDDEALSLLRTGDAVAVNSKDSDVEVREVKGTPEATKRATTTRERQAQSKRAHEPLNLGAADAEQPVEDDNGPRLPEVNGAEAAKVADPAIPTQSENGPTGETAEPSESSAAAKKTAAPKK